MIEIYTDGSSRTDGNESSQGAAAYVILEDGKLIYRSAKKYGTASNQQMELQAAINGCNKIVELKAGQPFFECVVYSDSAYVVNCKKDGWYISWELNGWLNSRGQPVANQNRWKELITFFDDSRFKFKKVKGHTGNKDYNDMVDKLAVAAVFGQEVDEFVG